MKMMAVEMMVGMMKEESQRHQSKVSFDCEDSFPTPALMIGWIGSVKLLTRNPDLGKY